MLSKLFPNLQKDGFKTTSPATLDYNCIAWAADDTEKIWWPDIQNIGYWPEGTPRNESLDAFVKAFETLGYTRCDQPDYEDGFKKVALYVDVNGKPTHASKQLRSGLWSSKLGRLEDIEHSIDGVNGSYYGSPALFMKRPNL
jgi:hypothetical protein